LFARLLRAIPLKSKLWTLISSFSDTVVSVKDKQYVMSMGCSASATEMNIKKTQIPTKFKELAFFRLAITIPPFLLVYIRKMGNKKASKGTRNPLEVSRWHLQDFPSHDFLQKLRR
jgi:hypothetical protein